jgi:hypothetical protein
MPVYTIQVADGRKIKLESPDPDTALHDADAWAASNPAKRVPAPRVNAPRRGQAQDGWREGAGFAANMSESLFPWSEELISAPLGSVIDTGRDLISGRAGLTDVPKRLSANYARNLDALEGQRDDFRTRRPLAAAGAKGIGNAGAATLALATGGASLEAQGAGGAVRSVPRLKVPMLGRVAQGGTAGGAFGFMYGSGDARGDFGDRLRAGAEAVPAGVGMGAALPPAVGALAKVGGALADSLTGQGAANRAARMVEGAFDAAPRRASGNPNEMAWEAGGRRVRGLARALSTVQGPGAEIAEQAVTSRAAGRGDRLAGSIHNAAGDGAEVYPTLEGLDRARRSQAAPLYEAAHETPIFASDMEHVAPLLDAAGPDVLRKAQRLARLERVPSDQIAIVIDDNAGTVQLSKHPNFRTLDYVKRAIDDTLEGYRDKTTGRVHLDQEGRALSNLRGDLVDVLDRMSDERTGGAFRQARSAWAGPSAQMDALNAGRRILSGGDPEAVQIRWRRMSADERDAFRLGVARALSDQAMTNEPATLLRRLSRDKLAQKRLQTALGDDFAPFMNDVLDELRMANNENWLLKGSPTARIQAEIQAATETSGPMNVVERRLKGQTFRNQLGQAAAHGFNRLARPGVYDPEVNRIASEHLFGPDGARTFEPAVQARQRQIAVRRELQRQALRTVPRLTESVSAPRRSTTRR